MSKKKKAGTPRVEFRAGTIKAELAARGDRPAFGLLARRDLERYYHALEVALRGVELERQEALLLCDALNGTLIDVHTVPLLPDEIEDAAAPVERGGLGLGEKWLGLGPEGRARAAALVEKLRSLSYVELLAILDAVERWWHRPPTEGESYDDSLRRVGLLRGGLDREAAP